MITLDEQALKALVKAAVSEVVTNLQPPEDPEPIPEPTPEPEPEPEPSNGLSNNMVTAIDAGYRHIALRWPDLVKWDAPWLIQRVKWGESFEDPKSLGEKQSQSPDNYRWLGVDADHYTDLEDIEENTTYVYRVAALLNYRENLLRNKAPVFSKWLYGKATTGELESEKKKVIYAWSHHRLENGNNLYPALLSALAEASGSGGGIIKLPSGDFDIIPERQKDSLFNISTDNIEFRGGNTTLTFWLAGKRPLTEWDWKDGYPRRHYVFLTNNCKDFTLRGIRFEMNAKPVNAGKDWQGVEARKYQWDITHKLIASFDDRKFDRVLIEDVEAYDCRGEMIYNGGGSGKILIKNSKFSRSNSSTISGTFDLEMANVEISDSANASVESMIKDGRNHIARDCKFIGVDTLRDVPGKKNFAGWLVFNAEGTYQSVSNCTFENHIYTAYGPWYEARNTFRVNCTFKPMSDQGASHMFYLWTSPQKHYKLSGGFSNALWIGDTVEVDRNWPNHRKFFYTQAQNGIKETPWRWIGTHFKKTGSGTYKINRLWEDVGGKANRSDVIFADWTADEGISFDQLYLQIKDGAEPVFENFLT